jgi:hypothetical protein
MIGRIEGALLGESTSQRIMGMWESLPENRKYLFLIMNDLLNIFCSSERRSGVAPCGDE